MLYKFILIFLLFATGNLLFAGPDENSFSGVFKGTMPSRECPGIDVTLYLEDDLTYYMVYKYRERSFTYAESGCWSICPKTSANSSLVEDKSKYKLNTIELYSDKGNRTFLEAQGSNVLNFLDFVTSVNQNRSQHKVTRIII